MSKGACGSSGRRPMPAWRRWSTRRRSGTTRRGPRTLARPWVGHDSSTWRLRPAFSFKREAAAGAGALRPRPPTADHGHGASGEGTRLEARTGALGAITEFLDGLCANAGMDTPPLDPHAGGRLRELRTGVGRTA